PATASRRRRSPTTAAGSELSFRTDTSGPCSVPGSAPADGPDWISGMRAGVAACVLLLVAVGCRPDAPPSDVVVEHVVDGDTVDVVLGDRRERVRLIGIDTPEVYVQDGPPECFGPEASAYTKQLLPEGTQIRLERDVVG